MIGRCRRLVHGADQLGHFRPRHLGGLQPAELRHDMVLEDVVVADRRAGLVVDEAVLLHVALGQLLYSRRAAQRLPLGAGVLASAHGGQVLLGELAGLIDGERAEDAEAGLAPLASGGAVGQHENLASGGRHLTNQSG